MKTTAQGIGARGERAVAAHYEALGYRLLQSNYRTRFGEVDLVLEKDGMLVFCEVKTRGVRTLDTPAASVDAQKQRKLRLAAQGWLQQRGLSDPPLRFDVAEVLADKDDKGVETFETNIIKNAF